MANYEFLFAPRTEDVDVELKVEGALPPLAGSFYGMTSGGCRVGDTGLHQLDSHGRVIAVTIANGRASLRARMVNTPLWQAERSAKDIVKRRLFRNLPKRWSNLFNADLGNPAGHNVVRFGKHLVACNDPGFFVLDPVTLETRGAAPIGPAKGATFSPMPRRDPATGRHVVFETRPGRRDTIVVREIDDEFGVASEQTYKLPSGAGFFHDVAMTPNYYLIMQFGTVSIPAFLWGASPVADAVRFDPSATPVLYLLPRNGGEPIAVKVPGGRTHFHFWNAFEVDGRVVADTISYAGRVDFGSTQPRESRPPNARTPDAANLRHTIDPKSRTVDVTALTDVPAEAPEIHGKHRGRPYRYGWAPAPGSAGDEEDRNAFVWYHALARHDFEARTTQQWDAGPNRYVSAAAFVPREGASAEDDGHVLAFIQDAAKEATSIGIFDASNVAKGPIAELTGAGLVGGITHVSYGA